MRESKKVECLQFPISALLSVLRCLPSQLDQSSLFFVQRQVETPQSLAQFFLKQFCLAPMLKPYNKVVRVAHHDYFSSCSSPPPLLHPLIERIVKIDVRKHWAHYPSNNVANTVLEFSVSVPREELRPGYGHGFLGAPLTENSPDRPTQQDHGEGCDKSTNRRSRRPGGHNGV